MAESKRTARTIGMRPATTADRDVIHDLLRRAELPIPKATEAPVEFVVAYREGEDRPIGCVGWEEHGSHTLLRSVVIAPEARARGAGTRLVTEALRILAARERRDLWLVTMDRAHFFERLGFTSIDRDQVPAPVRESPEYRIHECVGGTWMRRSG